MVYKIHSNTSARSLPDSYDKFEPGFSFSLIACVAYGFFEGDKEEPGVEEKFLPSLNIYIHLDTANEEDTLEPVSRELPEELAYGSEGQSSDSDGLVMSSASVHGAGVPQVNRFII